MRINKFIASCGIASRRKAEEYIVKGKVFVNGERITELGWQVMYFSAKGEIKEALREDIDCGNINYVELPGILA